jgi:hypothetical protein
MNFNKKTSCTVLLTFVLLSGLFFLPTERSAHSLSISGINIDELTDFEGLDDISGLIGLEGPQGPEGPAGAPCPNQHVLNLPGTVDDGPYCVP